MFKKNRKQKQHDTGKETGRNKNAFSDLCARHPQKNLELFCSECDEVYCKECINTGSHDRDKHHKLDYISDFAFVFEESGEFKHYDKNIFALSKKLERSTEKTTENMKLSTQLQDEAENRIKKQKETLIELIETHYQDISEKNKKRNENCLTKLKDVLEQSNGLKTQFEEIEKEIIKKRTGKMATLFIAIKKSKLEIKKIEEEIGRLNGRNNITRYVFEAGEQALTFMKNMDDFGDLVDENLNSGEKDITFTTLGPLDSTLDDNHSIYAQPQFDDSAISMSSLQQLSKDSKESLNSSNGSSEAVPKYKPERDPSPQDYSIPEHEQKIVNTVPPKLGPRPLDLVIEQTTESKDFKDRGFGSRIQETVQDPSPQDFNILEHEQKIDSLEMYKVWHPYTSDDESYLSCKKGDIVTVLNKCLDGIHWLAKLEGQVGLIRNDYLVEVSESGQYTSAMDQLGGPLDHDSRIFDEDQAFDRTVRDPSPQDFSVPEHEQTIDSTGPTQPGNYSSGARNKPTVPPKPCPKPSTQMIRQARERHSSRGRGIARQTQPEPNKKYKVLYTDTTRNEEYLSYIKGDIVTVLKKCSGDFVLAELKGQSGYIRKDHLEGVVETGSNANVLSELETKLKLRYIVS